MRLLGMLCLLLLICWTSLFAFSSFPITPEAALAGVWGPDRDQISQVLVHDLRLPRLLLALLVGAALAVAGALMQGITQNPLASPGLFGVTAGAGFAMALVSTLPAWLGLVPGGLAAVLGGGLGWLLVMLVGGGWQPGRDKGQLVLAGVAVTALCGAGTKTLVMLAEDQAVAVLGWLAGSLAQADWDKVALLWPLTLPLLLLALLLAPALNLLGVGEERAISLGLRLGWLRLWGSLLVLMLVGITVFACGALGFVGLLVPHMARALVGMDMRRVLPLCLLLGGALVATADLLGRALVFPSETPVGVVLALLGAPYFLYLVRGRR
ncbi:iron chelate uptake ABC transporter family permease subunit [Aeromonas crassostreae]